MISLLEECIVIMMNPESYTIGQLLQTRFPMFVPKYQRSYAWDELEISYFCEDIKELWDQQREGDHFFGGIVTVATPVTGKAGWSHSYEIVDGQQRLATFGMLISVLADELRFLAKQNALGDEYKETADAYASVLAELLTFKPIVDGKRKCVNRINLSGVDRAVYESILENPSKTPSSLEPHRESHRRLENARKELVKFVRYVSRDDNTPILERLNRMLALQDTVLNKCTVIHIMSDNRTEARRVFSVINNRGRSLGAGDLLRAATLELAEGCDSASDRIEEAWDQILVDSETTVDDYLAIIFSSFTGRRPKNHLLYEEFLKEFYPVGNTPGTYAEQTERLQAEFSMLKKLEAGEWPYSSSSPNVKDWDRSRIRHVIQTLDHRLALPLLLSAAQSLPEDSFASIVHMIELTAFRYKIICNAHTSPLSAVYLTHSKYIRQQGSAYQTNALATSLQSLLNTRADDQFFTDSLKAQLGYGKGKKTHIRYFFSVIESYYDFCSGKANARQPDKSFSVLLDNLTIEHIYPQNPETRDADLDPVVHDLGNLTVLAPDDNLQLGNAPWATKRTALANSRLRLNRELSQFEQWTLGEVQKWRETLLKYAVRAFSLV